MRYPLPLMPKGERREAWWKGEHKLLNECCHQWQRGRLLIELSLMPIEDHQGSSSFHWNCHWCQQRTIRGHQVVIDHVDHGSCWWCIKNIVKALGELIWTWIYTQRLGELIWTWIYIQRLPHITCGTLSLSKAPWVQQAQNIMMTWVGLEARLNRCKLIILIQIVDVSEWVSLWWRGVFDLVKWRWSLSDAISTIRKESGRHLLQVW